MSKAAHPPLPACAMQIAQGAPSHASALHILPTAGQLCAHAAVRCRCGWLPGEQGHETPRPLLRSALTCMYAHLPAFLVGLKHCLGILMPWLVPVTDTHIYRLVLSLTQVGIRFLGVLDTGYGTHIERAPCPVHFMLLPMLSCPFFMEIVTWVWVGGYVGVCKVLRSFNIWHQRIQVTAVRLLCVSPPCFGASLVSRCCRVIFEE